LIEFYILSEQKHISVGTPHPRTYCFCLFLRVIIHLQFPL
jgi:hypothetical protein